MPTTKTVLIYQFEELDDKAKERARDWWRGVDANELVDSIDNDEYFQSMYKEAGYTFDKAYWSIDRDYHYCPDKLSCDNIMLALTNAGIARNQSLAENYLVLARTQWRNGNYKWELHYSAPESKKRISAFLENACDALNNQLEDLEHKALKAINSQNDWLNSNEYIDDMLVSNEYEFLENGKRA